MAREADHDSPILRARERVEALATEDGAFVVAGTETGVSPPPVSRARFGSYDDAERARDAAERYREAMRDLDPGLERYDLVACEVAGTDAGFASVRETTADRRANGLPRTRRTVTVASDGRDEWLRVENAPVVHLAGPDAPLDDEVIERQLRTTLGATDRR
jgi:hypothetical protein